MTRFTDAISAGERAPAAIEPTAAARLVYLDVLRGGAVIIMVLAHVVDSWTREADRHDFAYYTAVFVGGLGAPLFLFLAGVAQVMSADAKARRAGAARAGRDAMWQRGWEVFALAWLFRLQSQLLGWGALSNVFKVDILNVMGLSMVLAALLWALSPSRGWRIAALAVAAGVATFATPIVRELPWLAALPDPIEGYLRPAGGFGAFSMFPWAGFLFAGGVAGELVDAARQTGKELRLQAWLAVAGIGGVALAWWTSFRPSIYLAASFWTSSPTFFFIRLGICTALMPATWAHCRFWLGLGEPNRARVEALRHSNGGDSNGGHHFSGADTVEPAGFWRPGIALTRAVELLGRSSLFVYWIHVEMVYGVLPTLIKRGLPLWASVLGTLLLCWLLFEIVRMKNRWMEGVVLPSRLRIFAAVLR